MSTFTFRPSEKEKVSKTLLLAIVGTTGSGKTESAMRIATGIVKPNGRFAVIDTERKRALNKKSRYNFDHLDLQAPYEPKVFKEAIDYAEGLKKYGALVIDNFSHEWFGEGGCVEMQEKELEKLAGNDMGKAQRLSALAWKKPKQEHKKLMYRILQCELPLIFCLRAEPKIKFQKDSSGKTEVVDAGWQPICEKMFGFEMLVYALLMPENPGVPIQLKKLEPEFEKMFPIGEQITEEAGVQLIQWARADSDKQQESTSEPEQDQPEDDKRIKDIKEILKLLKKINITRHENVLFFIKEVIGRDIKSLKLDLTDEELEKILDHLRGMILNEGA